ncbi:MAG: hypothetical protein L3J76_04310 [Candidatus Hydrothermae bacterium]|nr:hypothetical protein [Candidatus Hydrothermae bacterium]
MKFLHPWHEHLQRNTELSFTTFFGEPVVLHCHHFNLFLDQTVEDPPYVPGRRILFKNAYEASYCLLKEVRTTLQTGDPEHSMRLFLDLIKFLGLGTFELVGPLKPDRGSIRGMGRYSRGWMDKYGGNIRRDRGVEYFLRGFLAAAVDVAFDLDPGYTRVRELRSPLFGDSYVELEIQPPDEHPLPLRPCIGLGDWENLRQRQVPPSGTAPPFDVGTFARDLSHIADQLHGDERGLMEAYQVYITRHLVRYYNGISADFYLYFEHNRDLVNVAEDLLQESGHVCVFHTFGNMLADPEIRLLAGGLPTPEHYIFATAAIGRALGFGDWEVARLEPGRMLDLQTSQEYEGCHFRALQNTRDLPLFFMPGAAAAAMNLAYLSGVPQGEPLTHEAYNRLMLGEQGDPFHGKTIRGCHRGDPYTLVRAERASS